MMDDDVDDDDATKDDEELVQLLSSPLCCCLVRKYRLKMVKCELIGGEKEKKEEYKQETLSTLLLRNNVSNSYTHTILPSIYDMLLLVSSSNLYTPFIIFYTVIRSRWLFSLQLHLKCEDDQDEGQWHNRSHLHDLYPMSRDKQSSHH